MFEFWGLSRGYGLAIAFMTASIYYMLLYMQHYKIVHLYLSLLISILSVYSNFTLLNFYCALVAAIIFLKLLSRNKGFIKSFLKNEFPAITICSCILYLLVAGPITLLRARGQLYYGGERDIFNDTIVTEVSNNVYKINSVVIIATSYIVLITTIIAGIYWLIGIARRKTEEPLLIGVALWLLPVVAALSTIAQYLIFHTKYLIDRTALFFIPLYILQFIFWIYALKFKKISVCILILVTSLSTFNFIRNINLTSTLIWRCNAFDLFVLNRIVSESKNNDHKPRICVDWLSYPSMQFYKYTKYSKDIDTIVEIKSAPSDNPYYDYYYLPSPQTHALSKMYVVDTSFQDGGYQLLRRQ